MLERIENTIKAFDSCLIFTDQGHALEVFKVGTLHLTFIIFFIRKQNASLVNAQLPHESSFRHTMCPPQPSRFALSIFCKPRHRGAHHTTSESKHLKGQLDPRVGDGHVFCIKGVQLDPRVGDGHVFWTKGGQLDLPVGDVTFF